MTISTASKNVMLDNSGWTAMSLHTAYSASGANEVTGGSPAYARIAITLSAASGGSKAISNQPAFNVPAGTTVRWVGWWAGATFAGMEPNSGSEKEFWIDVSTDVVTSPAHGYSNGDKIVFYGGSSVPGGLVEGTVYFVVTATSDSFQVAATAGGAAINLTSYPDAGCVVSKIVEEVYASQSVHTITSASRNLNG
jgi:hypothetical protein